jgi:hypothetical protein
MRDLNKDIEVNAPVGQTYIAEASFFASNLSFDYHPPALKETWQKAWPFAGYLLLWFGFSLLLSRHAGSTAKIISE